MLSSRGIARHCAQKPPATRTHYLSRTTNSSFPLMDVLDQKANAIMEVVPPRHTFSGARRLPGFAAVLRHPDVSE